MQFQNKSPKHRRKVPPFSTKKQPSISMAVGSSDDENGGVFNLSEDLVQSPAHKSASTGAIDFAGLLGTPLKLHEDLAKGCGGQLWPAGMVLATYMLRRHRESLRDKTMLALALGCSPLRHPLHITDQEPMLELMRQNIALNHLDGSVEASILDWGTSTPSNIPSQPDIILAADCVYFEPAFPLLQQTLKELVGDSTTVYFCFKRRRRADLQFIKTARKLFEVKPVDDDPDAPIYSRQNIFL
ncbi:MAG: hypothetical protein M1819_001981 [Sarea resinae]|nr:MAG: hypothetical protein M1819_001981 [Sarea resinae]